MPEKLQTVIISVVSIIALSIIDNIDEINEVLKSVFNLVIGVLTIFYLVIKIINQFSKRKE